MGSRSVTDTRSGPGALDALAASLGGIESKKAPPVHLWNPPYCGEIGLRIAADGTWFYLGSPIGRASLVKLFASVLRKDEDGRHYMVTPVEKIGIEVEDSPFLAVEMAAQGSGNHQQLAFRTNVDDLVVAGPDHPMRFEGEAAIEGLRPYLLVRGALEARLTRPLYYDLVELGRIENRDGADVFGVWSGGGFFAMTAADELSF